MPFLMMTFPLFLMMTSRFEKGSGDIYMVQELLGLLSRSAETETAETLTDETLMKELALRGYDLSRLRADTELDTSPVEAEIVKNRLTTPSSFDDP